MIIVIPLHDLNHFKPNRRMLYLRGMKASSFMSQTLQIMNKGRQFFNEIGELAFFAGRFLKEFWKRPYEFKELLHQCYQIGNRSMTLVGITGFIIGLVLTLQTRPTLLEFGAVSWMPSMVGISIVREVGPVVIALICAGRVASGSETNA